MQAEQPRLDLLSPHDTILCSLSLSAEPRPVGRADDQFKDANRKLSRKRAAACY